MLQDNARDVANTISNGVSEFTGGWRELFNGDFKNGLSDIVLGGGEAVYGEDFVTVSNVVIDGIGLCSMNSLLKAKGQGRPVPFLEYLSEIEQAISTKGVKMTDAIAQVIRENTIKNGLTWIDMYDSPQSVLPNNAILMNGRYLMSPYGNFYLVMQADGNLVLYSSGQFIPHFATWSSNTKGKGSGPYHLVMQNDANLVIYDSTGAATWSSNTWSPNPSSSYRLVVQDDGNVVLYDANNGVSFSTGTNIPNPPAYPDSIPQNGVYTSGSYILSRNGQYQFIMQTDGNLVLYDNGHAVWASGQTPSGVISQLQMQSDANVVCYDVSNRQNPVAYWASGSQRDGSDGPYHIVMQNDRNCVVYNAYNTAIWSTGTYNG